TVHASPVPWRIHERRDDVSALTPCLRNSSARQRLLQLIAEHRHRRLPHSGATPRGRLPPIVRPRPTTAPASLTHRASPPHPPAPTAPATDRSPPPGSAPA